MPMERWLRQGIDDRFLAKLAALAPSFGAHPAHVLAVMFAESGLRADARNPKSRATGLIQFMPDTAIAVGTTVDALLRMSPFDQLDYVARYYRPKVAEAAKGGRSLNTTGQLYTATFWPAALPLSDDAAIVTRVRDGNNYAWNTVLDVDKDGVITKRELAERIRRVTDFDDFRLLAARLALLAPNLGPPAVARASVAVASSGGALALLAAAAAFFLWSDHGKAA